MFISVLFLQVSRTRNIALPYVDVEKVGVSWNVDVESERRRGKRTSTWKKGGVSWNVDVESGRRRGKQRQGHQTSA